MVEEKKLFPFRLEKFEDTFPWGSESLLLADLGYRDTAVRDGWVRGNSMGDMMETFLDRLVGDDVFEWYGQQFPFQVKEISCKGKMPLMVCPDDETARQRYDALGKEKLWYIVSAAKGARIYAGLSKEMSVADFFSACEDCSIERGLKAIVPEAGSFVHIPAGTPHCASGNLTILEVSESSAMDFCLCNWGAAPDEDEFDPELNLVEALDFVSLQPSTVSLQHPGHSHEEHGAGHQHGGHLEEPHHHIVEKLLALPQFTVSRINLSDPLHIYTEKFDSCLAYTCISGLLELKTSGADLPGAKDNPDLRPVRVIPGETVLVPAECPDFFLAPAERDTVLLETMVEKREEVDPYTGEPEGHEHEHEHEHCDCDHDDDDCHCGHDHDCHCGHDKYPS